MSTPDSCPFYTEWLTPKRVAEELKMDYKRVRGWIKREEDPLPAYYIDDNERESRVFRPELNEWIKRNSEEVNKEWRKN